MTGCTGSLRYMAPEVASILSYNHKVDVYSYGIILWQMASNKVPFDGLNRAEFLQRVAQGNERPPLSSSWPVGFRNLLEKCWHPNAIERPNFDEVLNDLQALKKNSYLYQTLRTDNLQAQTSFLGGSGNSDLFSAESIHERPLTPGMKDIDQNEVSQEIIRGLNLSHGGDAMGSDVVVIEGGATTTSLERIHRSSIK
jgi:serine/threonine protein kinase